jgi:hypothetical protein
MLEGKNYRRWARSFVAACLSLLFSFGCLTPLAAGAFTPSASCGSNAQCCCRKAHRSGGIAISGRSCQSECGRVTLGGNGITVYAQPRTSAASPVIVPSGRALPTEFFAHLFRPAASHRQRPPPSLPLA